MSPVVARLEPIHGQNEVLFSGFVQRPTLTVDQENLPLVLGRNQTTGIALTSISRKAATITYSDGNVWITQQRPENLLHENTIRRLAKGDVVCLQKEPDAYAYRVHLHETPNSTTTTTTTPCPTTPTTSSLSTCALQEASEEVMCAVCMEIIVEATAVVPCGHTYCGACLHSLSECPNCRLAVTQTIPLKGMDNLIHKLVLSQNVFCPHDMQQYWKRIKRDGVRYVSCTQCGLLAFSMKIHITNFFLFCSYLLYSHLLPQKEFDFLQSKLHKHLT
jgi:hypothetical protein